MGTARRFSTATGESLIADLRRILAPQYANRAREIATQLTKPAAAVAAAADLVEDLARSQSSMTGHPIHQSPHGLRSASKR